MNRVEFRGTVREEVAKLGKKGSEVKEVQLEKHVWNTEMCLLNRKVARNG